MVHERRHYPWAGGGGPGGGPGGGLGHLDAALGGAITRLRADGIFRAGPGEVLTLSAPAPPIHAATILAIGLGDPTAWTPAAMRPAVATAVRETIRLDAASAAFAPSLLDSGLSPAMLDGTPQAMLAGLFDALADRTAMLAALPGVFVAGEMVDWEAPTGGYLLTACFASGRTAGRDALSWLAS